MKIRNILNGQEYDAEITTEHSACSYGQAAVVVNGEAIDPVGIEIVSVTEDERAALPPHWVAVA